MTGVVERVENRASGIKCNFRKRSRGQMELPVHRWRKFEGETNQGLQHAAVSDDQNVLVVVFLAEFIQHGLDTNG